MNSRGFTIVELLVSVTIALIITGWAFMSFQKFAEFWDSRALSAGLRTSLAKNDHLVRSGKITSYMTLYTPGSPIVSSELDWMGTSVRVGMLYSWWQAQITKPTMTGSFSVEAFRRGTYTGTYLLSMPTTFILNGHDKGPYKIVAQDVTNGDPIDLNSLEFWTYAAFANPDDNSVITLDSVSDGVHNCDPGRAENVLSMRKYFCVVGGTEYETGGLVLRFSSDSGLSLTLPIGQ